MKNSEKNENDKEIQWQQFSESNTRISDRREFALFYWRFRDFREKIKWVTVIPKCLLFWSNINVNQRIFTTIVEK